MPNTHYQVWAVAVEMVLKYMSNFTCFNDTFVVMFSATVLDYLRAHDEKMLEKMGLDVNHKSMLNPWAGDNSRPSSMVNHRVGHDLHRPDGAVASQPLTLMKSKSSVAATTCHRGRAGQILIYLLRLRQCCSHLSILRDVSASTAIIDIVILVYPRYQGSRGILGKKSI